MNLVINDDLVFKIKTICKFLPNPTPNPIPCPNLIPYFCLSIKSSNLGMKSENWGPSIKIKDEIFFKKNFWERLPLEGFLKVCPLLGTFL